MRLPTSARTGVARATAALVGSVALLAACAGSPPSPAPPTPARSAAGTSANVTPPATPAAPPRTVEPSYAPVIDPGRFSTTIDNPYYPLVPGTRFIYEGTTADGVERNVVEVTHDTKVVMGVSTRVVHDTVEVDGKAEEETFDWYAQDSDGNVWYFGEDTRALGGPTVDTSGSFTAGVDGALPGIIMPGQPVVGDHYRQEYYKGKAEDTAKVLSLTGSESARFGGAQMNLLVTEDINPLEPDGAVENKYYAKGVGQVLTVHVTGPAERVELVSAEKS
jgi:hypothetical protein